MNISTEIRTIRRKAFLTQIEFADELSVAFSTVNRWENGKGIPNNTAIKKLKFFLPGETFLLKNQHIDIRR